MRGRKENITVFWQNIFVVLCMFCFLWHGKNVCSQDFYPPSRIKQDHPIASTVLPPDFSPSAIVAAFERVDSDDKDITALVPQSSPSLSIIDQQENAATFRHNFFQQSAPRSCKLQKIQRLYETVTKILQQVFDLTPHQVVSGLTSVDLASILQDGSIQECKNLFNIKDCNANDRYRTFNGTCNNLKHPSWGMASSCFDRLLDPVYADGISKVRTAVSGRPLPPPRKISLEIHSHFENPTFSFTHIFNQWGQFISHDISLTPLRQRNGRRLVCCPPNDTETECAPILLEQNDPFFSQFGKTCLNNARSAICSTCALGPRRPINQVTAFIDGSMIYGTSIIISDGLRDKNGSGTLKSLNRDNSELLPPSSVPANDGCSFQSQTETCFQAGDFRVNQQVALTSFHTIFLRHHNKMAKKLKILNPEWAEDKLFQETRRIIGAQLQMITYNEFLPLVLGLERMQWFDLVVQRKSIYTEYDTTVQPSLVIEFSTVAFRFGHSLVNSFFTSISKSSSSQTHVRDLFLWPFDLFLKGHLESVIRGMVNTLAQSSDRHMVRDLTNHLYQLRGNQSGLDLASINIMRGRDHGIPPYVQVLHFCGGPNVTTFQQLEKLFQPFYVQIFHTVYESVEDIDLFSGGLAERPMPGAAVGPTFSCIIGIQFYHLKYGDRFYFEHGGEAGSFTPNQLRELKKTTFAKIICDNTDIDRTLERVMAAPVRGNRPVPCQKLPDIDLQFWRE